MLLPASRAPVGGAATGGSPGWPWNCAAQVRPGLGAEQLAPQIINIQDGHGLNVLNLAHCFLHAGFSESGPGLRSEPWEWRGNYVLLVSIVNCKHIDLSIHATASLDVFG
jgi:hypothetical protein